MRVGSLIEMKQLNETFCKHDVVKVERRCLHSHAKHIKYFLEGNMALGC